MVQLFEEITRYIKNLASFLNSIFFFIVYICNQIVALNHLFKFFAYFQRIKVTFFKFFFFSALHINAGVLPILCQYVAVSHGLLNFFACSLNFFWAVYFTNGYDYSIDGCNTFKSKLINSKSFGNFHTESEIHLTTLSYYLRFFSVFQWKLYMSNNLVLIFIVVDCKSITFYRLK